MVPKIMNISIKINLQRLQKKDKYLISLGTIATGILGNQPILPPKELKDDLHYVKSIGFKRVIIFRLGGLNKEYIKVINQFINRS